MFSPPPHSSHPPLFMLLGCTGVGKSDVALLLAQQLRLEIVCVDSMQVYRRMDIGTAKPTAAMRAAVPHHLLDAVEPSEAFSAARFLDLADAAIADIRHRGRVPLVVAGTPFYLMSLIHGLFEGPSADPAFRAALRTRAADVGTLVLHAELSALDAEAAARIHPNDLFRIERALEVHHHTGRPISEFQRQWSGPTRYEFLGIGLRRERENLAHRINARVRHMVESGLIDEVRALLAEPQPLSQQARAALGYAEIVAHLEGRFGLEEALEQIKVNTRRFAKSQRTWFRRFRTVQWVDVAGDEPDASIASRAATLLSSA